MTICSWFGILIPLRFLKLVRTLSQFALYNHRAFEPQDSPLNISALQPLLDSSVLLSPLSLSLLAVMK